jgi:hypothetical protein
MADTLSVEIKASLAWLFQDAIDLTTISDASKLDYSKSLADGVAADQADKLWSDQRTVAAGANDDLDLTALVNTVFGSTLTINLARVKAVLIVNTSTTAGDELRLDSSVANAFTAPFNGSATSQVEIGPDSALLLSNKKDGWVVTAGTGDVLRIKNPGANPITYKIVVVGTSA